MADTIRSRLTTYFGASDDLGGLPPSTRPTTTAFASSLRRPNSRLPPGP
jgi:hypothetical protein